MNNQEAIRILKEYIQDFTTGEEEQDRRAFGMAISALEAQQADRWIPVNESVPIVDNLVLCCVDGAVITGYYHEGWHLGRFNAGAVTHWKWMPEPWKEEQPC